MSKIRVAIVGVGNCANSLVQGVTYYKDAAIDQEIPGLMHANLGGYHISDIEFVGAYDVDAKKVGLDLADAMWASENNTIKFSDVPKSGVTVLRGETHDGLGRYYKETITESSDAPIDIVANLKAEKVDVLICYLRIPEITKITKIEIENSMLMEWNSEQQNIIQSTIYGEKQSLLLTEGTLSGMLK